MRLVFVMPCHRRAQVAHPCIRQLARTCAALPDATAVIVGDEAPLKWLAARVGLEYVRAENDPLGRKWNDGIEYACRTLGATHIVPIGSDDIVDHRLFTSRPPAHGEIVCRRLTSMVDETGSRIAHLHIPYDGGDGIRTIPVSMFAPSFRPCDDARNRAMDTSMWRTVSRDGPVKIRYEDLHPLQTVDFKTGPVQLNSYRRVLAYATGEFDDPWEQLAERYPAEAVEELRAAYRVPVAA